MYSITIQIPNNFLFLSISIIIVAVLFFAEIDYYRVFVLEESGVGGGGYPRPMSSGSLDYLSTPAYSYNHSTPFLPSSSSKYKE